MNDYGETFMEHLYQQNLIQDYVFEEDENGTFHWVKTKTEEWQPLYSFMEKITNKGEHNGSRNDK
tara:strand:- start:146 stop:340 length:195 start_codon:yes stop_codon:yes gene_type:complete